MFKVIDDFEEALAYRQAGLLYVRNITKQHHENWRVDECAWHTGHYPRKFWDTDMHHQWQFAIYEEE